jgi:hypothetical protein
MRPIGRALCAAAAAAAAAIAFASCGPVVPPSAPTLAPAVAISSQGQNFAITVAPWPLDATVAFLCIDRPGPEFTVEHPVPAVTAGCVPLDVSTTDDRLTATFNARSLSVASAGKFRLGRPASLAVAGSRGPVSLATVLPVVLYVPSAAPG